MKPRYIWNEFWEVWVPEIGGLYAGIINDDLLEPRRKEGYNDKEICS